MSYSAPSHLCHLLSSSFSLGDTLKNVYFVIPEVYFVQNLAMFLRRLHRLQTTRLLLRLEYGPLVGCDLFFFFWWCMVKLFVVMLGVFCLFVFPTFYVIFQI